MATIENCIYCSETYKGMWGANGGSASSENVIEKTEAQFMSGEVAYLLNNGDTDGTQTWYQDLTAETGDIHPVLTKTNSNTVYQVKLYCGGGKVDAGTTYANNTEAVTKEHNMPETASFNSEKKIIHIHGYIHRNGRQWFCRHRPIYTLRRKQVPTLQKS